MEVAMAAEPKRRPPDPPKPPRKRSQTVKPGRLPVSEFAFGLAGAASPFGEVEFPLPVEELDYGHLHAEDE
jgi:hypothetical protein